MAVDLPSLVLFCATTTNSMSRRLLQSRQRLKLSLASVLLVLVWLTIRLPCLSSWLMIGPLHCYPPPSYLTSYSVFIKLRISSCCCLVPVWKEVAMSGGVLLDSTDTRDCVGPLLLLTVVWVVINHRHIACAPLTKGLDCNETQKCQCDINMSPIVLCI